MFSDSFTRAQAPRNLDIGVVLGGAFGSIGKHWLVFAVATLLLFCLPTALVQIFAPFQLQPGLSPDQTLSIALRYLLYSVLGFYLLQPILAGLIAWTTWADLNRGAADTVSALNAVARHLLSLLAVNLIVAIGTGFGFVLLIVPGIMLSLAWQAAIPACVVEGLSPFDAISRSLTLTRGQRWRLFGLGCVAFAVGIGFGIIASLVTLMMGLNLTAQHTPVVIGVSAVLTGAGRLFGLACAASAYAELVANRGGGNVEHVAEVFA